MITRCVGVGHARCLVIGANDPGHVAGAVKTRRMTQQPERGREMGGMSPFSLRQ